MDKFSAEKRSEIMSRIRSKGTKTEIFVRHLLFGRGFRFRLNREDLPGKPDIVLTKWKTCIFVNGCFWHAHPGCKKAEIPETRVDFWTEKLNKNRERDLREYKDLLTRGWRVLVVWQCACLKTRGEILGRMMEAFIRGDELFAEIGRQEVEEYALEKNIDPTKLTVIE